MHPDVLTDSTVFRSTSYADCAVLAVAGEIDMSRTEAFREHLHALMTGEAPRVIVDLSLVSFMDSAGLGVLIGGLRNAARRGGSVRVVGTSRQLVELFNVTGIHKVLPLHPSVADAAAT